MSLSSYIGDSLARRVIFFTGKGGVGKSTLAWATALACQRRGKRVVVASWNTLDTSPRPFTANFDGIESLTLETLSCFREYALLILKFEKLYDTVFDNFVLKAFIQAAPGVSDTVIAGKIWSLSESPDHDLILVNLPSSGHAYSFFQSPLGVKKVFSVGFVSRETEKIIGMFQSPTTRIDFVTLPEELPMVESLQLKEKLDTHSLPFGFTHINQVTPRFELPPDKPVPETFAPCITLHRSRIEREKSGLLQAKKFQLPLIEIPRIVAPGAEKLIQSVSHVLEQA